MITFKKYILLNEWTRELMPEIYAALEKYDDPMVGVHFSKGIAYKGDEEETTPHIVEMGLKELEFKRFGSISVNHSAMKTIGLLRKRVFRL